MFDPTPWFIDNAEHSADVARTFAYAATNGAEGIISPGDLKVQPLNVPGQGVRVAPGGVIMLNRHPGGAGQSYIGRNPVEFTVPVTPTGSAGGRSDLIVAYVDDPQYTGQEPPNPLDYQYINVKAIEGVPAGTTNAVSLNLRYPAVALARIDFPASTGTVTASMITDLRQVALPRSERRLYTFQPTASARLDSTSWVDWPNYRWNVRVPEWATTVNIAADVVSGWINVGQTVGKLRVRFGDQYTQDTWYNFYADGQYGRRFNHRVIDDIPVPASMRGTTVQVAIQGHKSGGDATAYWVIDSYSYTGLDVEFREIAV